MPDSHRGPVRLLVLDAGGVIVSNQMPQLFRDLAGAADVSYDEVARAYLPLRRDLWSGALSEQRFWELLLAALHIASPVAWWQERVAELIRPGLPVGALKVWAEQVPVWVLSNHRSEWLLPALDRYGYAPFISHTIVSDTAGLVKPEDGCYRYLTENHDGSAGSILFVDDKVRNLTPAAEHGTATLEADPQGLWVSRCTQRLGSR